MPGKAQTPFRLDIRNYFFSTGGDAVAQLHRAVGDSPSSLEVFQSPGDVAPGDAAGGHGGMGLDMGILGLFSNLSDSVILSQS